MNISKLLLLRNIVIMCVMPRLLIDKNVHHNLEHIEFHNIDFAI